MPLEPMRDSGGEHTGTKAAMYAFRAAVVIALLTGLSLGVVYLVVSWPWSGRPSVDLTPSETQVVRPSGTPRSTDDLRFAVAAMVSAEATFSTYKRLVQRICRDIGRQEVFLISPSYAAVRNDIERGDLDVAFVCTGTYVHARQGGRIKLLVRPEFLGDRDYRCLLIVPAKSDRGSLDDLRGATIAYTDPESNTGCLVPTAVLARRGLDSNTFFKKHTFTGSHDKSIQAVALGLVDVAAVDSLIWLSCLDEDPALADKVKVIWRSPSFGAPPVVVPTTLDAKLVERLRSAFVALDKDEEGREILSSVGIKRFVEAKDEDYQTAIDLLGTLKQMHGEP
jgi:phosphonate transport system substrate-binding protein